MEKPKKKLTEKQIRVASLAAVLKGKTCFGESSYGVAGRMMNRFGYNLCAEFFQNMPDMRFNQKCVAYIEKCLQNEYVKRNPQGPDRVLVGLSQSMGR